MQTQVQTLGKHLSEVIAMDQVVTRSILAVLLARDLARGGDPRILSEQIHGTIDSYFVPGTPTDLAEIDRQRARDLADCLLAMAR